MQVALVARLQRDAGTNAADVLDQVADNIRSPPRAPAPDRDADGPGTNGALDRLAPAGRPVLRDLHPQPGFLSRSGTRRSASLALDRGRDHDRGGFPRHQAHRRDRGLTDRLRPHRRPDPSRRRRGDPHPGGRVARDGLPRRSSTRSAPTASAASSRATTYRGRRERQPLARSADRRSETGPRRPSGPGTRASSRRRLVVGRAGTRPRRPPSSATN